MTTAIKLFLTFAMCATIAFGAPDPPTLLGQWPGLSRGPVESVVKAGSTLYAALKTGGFSIYNVTATQNLERLGHLEFSDVCNDVEVVGNFAYLALGTAGFGIVDVTDPTNPQVVATLDTPGMVLNVAIVGKTAYLADWSGGLQIVDVTDSTNPKILGNYASSVWEVKIQNSLAYLASGSNGLEIVDVSNPAAPVRRGKYPGGGYVYHAAVAGNTAFMATQGRRLTSLDVSDPTNIKLITTYSYTNVTSMAVESSRLYLAAYGWGTLFAAVDITDPAQPTETGRLVDITGSGRMAIDSATVWLPSESAGIRAIDITNLSSPTAVGRTETAGETSDIVVQGNSAFVADGSAGLQVLDVTDPANIHSVGRYIPTRLPVSVLRAVDSLAAIVTVPAVEFLDVSNPSNITRLSESLPPAQLYWPVTLELIGRRAYVAGYGLWMVNLDDPTKPSTTVMVTNSVHFTELTLRDSILFATSPSAIMVFDISDPDNPRLLGQIGPSGGWSYGSLSIHGDVGFATTYYAGVEAIDFRDPRHPMTLGNSLASSQFGHLSCYGDYAFSGAWNWTMVNIQNPSDVKIVHENMAGSTGPATIVGERGYVPRGSGGLFIYKMPVVPPIILKKPKSAALASGDSTSLTVSVSGGAPMSYQWFRDGEAVLGATQSSLIVKSFEAGDYTVNVANPAGSVSSAPATVRVRNEMHFEQVCSRFIKPAGLEFHDGYAYMPEGTRGISIFDVKDPANLGASSVCTWPRDPRALRFANGLLYIADGASLTIWDFPNYPLPIGRVDFQIGTTDVYIHGTKALVALGQDRLRYGVALVDVSNPRAPALVSIWDGNYAPMKVAGTSSRMVGCAGYEGFRVFDAANPSIFAGAYVTEGIVSNAYVIGDLAIASLDEYRSWEGLIPPGIQIFDISQSSRPASIARIAVDAPTAIGGDGKFFYAGFDGGGFKAYDFTDPTHPQLVGSYDDPNLHPYLIKAINPYIYLCDSVNGTLIYKASPAGDVAVQARVSANGGVKLSWPAGFGAALQQSASLSPPLWTDVPATSEQLEVPSGGGTTFYRLKLP